MKKKLEIDNNSINAAPQVESGVNKRASSLDLSKGEKKNIIIKHSECSALHVFIRQFAKKQLRKQYNQLIEYDWESK